MKVHQGLAIFALLIGFGQFSVAAQAAPPTSRVDLHPSALIPSEQFPRELASLRRFGSLPREVLSATTHSNDGGKVPLVRYALPDLASGSVHLSDPGSSGVAIELRLRGAEDASVRKLGPISFFANARGAGVHQLLAPSPNGVEDWLVFESGRGDDNVSYELKLSGGAAGLRLINGTLEVLDSAGAPRLHMTRPYVIDAQSKRSDATVEVIGCAYDTNPAVP